MPEITVKLKQSAVDGVIVVQLRAPKEFYRASADLIRYPEMVEDYGSEFALTQGVQEICGAPATAVDVVKHFGANRHTNYCLAHCNICVHLDLHLLVAPYQEAVEFVLAGLLMQAAQDYEESNYFIEENYTFTIEV